MNFKILILLFMIAGCGVKGDPTSPKSPRIPSILEDYPDVELEQPLQEHKRKR